jgi:hypothetical protein
MTEQLDLFETFNEFIIKNYKENDFTIYTNIFNKFNDIEKVIFTKNEKFFKKYNTIMINEYSEKILDRILLRQWKLIEKYKKVHNIILIFDDVSIKEFGKNLRTLIYNYRCYGIYPIFSKKHDIYKEFFFNTITIKL